MNRFTPLLVAAAIIAFAVPPLYASMPIYMNYGEIRAELMKVDFGDLKPRDLSTGHPTGRRQYQPIIIRKRIDKASPILMKTSAKGERIPSIVLEFTEKSAQGREQTYMIVTLHDVLISSVQTGGSGSPSTQSGSAKNSRMAPSASSGGEDRPMESLSLNFTKIEYKRLDGKTTAMDDWAK